MKAQMFKLAGVKTDKEFYKLFPDEESFMAKYGKQLKKMQSGGGVPGYVDSGAGTYELPTNNIITLDDYQLQENNGYAFEGGPDGNKKITPMKDMLANSAGAVGNIMQGFSALEAEKQAKYRAKQSDALSKVTLQASTTRPEMRERRYVRPEDNINSGEAFFPTYGVGTNVLAKYGKNIKAEEGFDFGEFMTGGGGEASSSIAGYATGNNAGGSIGGGFGELAGTAFGGPVGGMIGKTAGTLIGGLIDQNPRQTKMYQKSAANNNMNMYMNQQAPMIQAGYANYLEDGGEISSMEQDGSLQTHWGGKTENLSYNPFLPEGGETVMFRGKGHDKGGIGITYGGNPVEVERGEPATQLPGENGESSLTVFGDLKIPKEYVAILGDKRASGKKFKSYVADLSKQEAKLNNRVENSLKEINEMSVTSSFDKLAMKSLELVTKGSNMKLKEIADRKIKAGELQNILNMQREEKASAKNGKNIPKAQNGINQNKVKAQSPDKWDYTQAGQTGNPIWDNSSRYDNEWTPSVNNAYADPVRAAKMINYIQNYTGPGAEKIKAQLNGFASMEDKITFLNQEGTNRKVGPVHFITDAAIRATMPEPDAATATPAAAPAKVNNQFEVSNYKRNGLADMFNSALPFLRPTDQEPLDPNQLLGENYALSTNQLEPVQAQTYQPDINTPYDISYQDQLNANQSDFRSMQKLIDHNPANMSLLASQKYEANSKVLGEQFRQNQGVRSGVFDGNRNVLNDSKLRNLSIYDKQFERQSKALSTTKATTQASLNSYSDKYAKNQLENRTLGIYENMYNYRYDAAGRAINMNPLYQPTIDQNIYSPNGEINQKIVRNQNAGIQGYTPIGAAQPSQIAQIPSMATSPYIAQSDYSQLTEDDDPRFIQKYGGKTSKKKYSQNSLVRDFK
jgi:hypothetical protein